MKKIIAIAWSMLMLSTTIFSQVTPECSFRLAGHVEDADTKETLQGATVRILELDRTIVTDHKGDFIFYNICPGTYTILVSHVNCDSVSQSVVLQKDRHLDIYLPHARNTLEEVVIASKTGTPNTGFKQELSGRQLDEAKGRSISEALSRINGVNLLQTGSMISKPVIHGLHSSRIVTINNGVRHEGQQWGNEHAPEIDAFIADKLTVIKGVDELKYGSDAIGGVILVQPKPLRSHPGKSAEVNLGYFTNNRQYVASAIFEHQPEKLAALSYRIQGTFKRGANVNTPNYRLNNTGSKEYNFSATAGWKKENFSTELFYSQFNTLLGIFQGAHIGNLTDLQNAIEQEQPDPVYTGQNTYKINRPYQDITHHIVKSKSQLIRNGHKFNLQVSGQFNNRKEYDIVRSTSVTTPQLNLSISTITQDLSWEHPTVKHFTGSVGLAGMQQDNAYAGRYFIPNYQAYSYGAYAIEKWSRDKWDIQAGIRFDHKRINTNRLLSGGSSFDEYHFRFNTVAGSVNTAYRFTNSWKANISASLSGRAPQVNELLSNGIHHGTATYEEGNINLKAEQSLNLSGTLSYQHPDKKLDAEFTVYRNGIRDFIYRQPVPGEPVLTIAGAFPLIRYRQTDAVLYGGDASVVIRPIDKLEWTSRGSVLRARNTTIKDWLILMPADRVSTELVYKPGDYKKLDRMYVSAEVEHVFRQTRTPDERFGKQDYKSAPAAYTLVHLNASARIKWNQQPIVFSFGVRNLLNTVYRDYLNSMRYFTDEMGRNINLRISIPLASI